MCFVYQSPTYNVEPYIICSYKDGIPHFTTSNSNFSSCTLTSDIQNFGIQKIKLFPNPAKDGFNLTTSVEINEIYLKDKYGLSIKK